ncbi:MAG: phenylalanine--tRNA ligase subunit beta [Candidatus Bathyarchaeia archaeon]
MPTITINLNDLNSLLGRELSLGEFREIVFPLKCGQVESVMGSEITLEVSHDRPDLFSVEGIARELKGILGIETGLPRYELGESGFKVFVDRSIEPIRPFISCAVVREVKLSEEAIVQAMQLQEKLHLAHGRRRRKVSIGIHDIREIAEEINYSAKRPDEIRFVPLGEDREMDGEEILELTLKGKEYGHIIRGLPGYPLLYDREGKVLSMPPIINGVVTKVTERTKDILIDVTGTDKEAVECIAKIMATSLCERGGRLETVEIIGPTGAFVGPDLSPLEMSLDVEMASKLLGLELSAESISESLRRMRYEAIPKGDEVVVLAPPYRVDILHPIDLIEDIAIGIGYGKLEPEPPSVPTKGRELPLSIISRKIRDLMIGFGFQEVVSYMMTSKAILFDRMCLREGEVVEVGNPLTAEYSVLRNWLLPSLLNFLSHNRHVAYPQRVFECGDVVSVDMAKPTRTRATRKLAAVICDFRASYEDAQAVVYSLLRNMGLGQPEAREVRHPSFIRGRVAEIFVAGDSLGILGEIHPEVLNNFGLEYPASAFELDVSKIMEFKRLK